jgi:hypothetical protein
MSSYSDGYDRALQDATETSPCDLTGDELDAAPEAFRRGYRDAQVARQREIDAAGGLSAYLKG